jgi:hypothetical protein
VRQFTYGGGEYLLGQSELGYGIWLVGREFEEPVIGYPPTEEGWNRAFADFTRMEPHGGPIAAPLPAVVPAPLPVPAYAAVPVWAPMAAPVGPRGNGMATTGGTVGIVGAVLSLIPIIGILIGLVMGVLAIIFGGVGMGRANGLGGTGKGMAITGLVLGILTVVFKLIPGVNLI